VNFTQNLGSYENYILLLALPYRQSQTKLKHNRRKCCKLWLNLELSFWDIKVIYINTHSISFCEVAAKFCIHLSIVELNHPQEEINAILQTKTFFVCTRCMFTSKSPQGMTRRKWLFKLQMDMSPKHVFN
jgi:hypothetical protein